MALGLLRAGLEGGHDEATVSHMDVSCVLPSVPPTLRQPSSGPQEMVPVQAGDKAVLSCETDSVPEPMVTWYRDGQPLVMTQRAQVLQGGQRLEILDSQVRSLGARMV